MAWICIKCGRVTAQRSPNRHMGCDHGDHIYVKYDLP